MGVRADVGFGALAAIFGMKMPKNTQCYEIHQKVLTGERGQIEWDL
jgi:hypothetical protein